jgi:hypothetical protein
MQICKLKILQIILKPQEIEEYDLDKKLLLIDTFWTIYYLYHLHIPFDNTGKNRSKLITTNNEL